MKPGGAYKPGSSLLRRPTAVQVGLGFTAGELRRLQFQSRTFTRGLPGFVGAQFLGDPADYMCHRHSHQVNFNSIKKTTQGLLLKFTF